MWLLKSRWSNPMKHLIPYLQDDQKAADYLRQLRWPDGVQCPRCGSDAVEPRERCDNGLQRFNCVPCAVRLGQQFAMFTDWTGSIFEESKLRPLDWLLVIGLWQLKLNATAIATAADIQARTAQRCINLLDGGIYETYHLEPTRQLVVHLFGFDRIENWVQSLEFHSGVGGGELPVDPYPLSVAVVLPGGDFALQCGEVRDATVETLMS
jgi:transposase-like protein